MNHEDDLALFELTEAARALLSTLAAEGIDIPETRALAFALSSARAPEIIPFDDPRHVPKVIGDRVYSPNGIFSWPRADFVEFVELGRQACRESIARVEQVMELPPSEE